MYERSQHKSLQLTILNLRSHRSPRPIGTCDEKRLQGFEIGQRLSWEHSRQSDLSLQAIESEMGGSKGKDFETLSTRNLVVLWSTGWNNMPRVLIVGDSTIFRRSLQTVLALCDGW